LRGKLSLAPDPLAFLLGGGGDDGDVVRREWRQLMQIHGAAAKEIIGFRRGAEQFLKALPQPPNSPRRPDPETRRAHQETSGGGQYRRGHLRSGWQDS